jgi:hypothetical protein
MNENPAAQYARAVEDERTAWQALQALPRGSARRAQAWTEWSQALSRTNQAWRRLSCHTQRWPQRAASGSGHSAGHPENARQEGAAPAA